MKLKQIALMFTAILVTGCGYENIEECRLKETQKCTLQGCIVNAMRYCEKEHLWKSDK